MAAPSAKAKVRKNSFSRAHSLPSFPPDQEPSKASGSQPRSLESWQTLLGFVTGLGEAGSRSREKNIIDLN